ncbi:MAG: hypothetical protein Kow0096_23910 [Thiohalomonadaceae bacterium]
MADAVLKVGFLESLETLAPTLDAGRQAFLTWSLVQSFGWAEARRRVPRSTWHRHLRLLAAAGLPVPPGRAITAEGPSRDGSGWFGASTHAEAAQLVAMSPGRLLELTNRRFRVVMPEDGADGAEATTAPQAGPSLRLVRPALPWKNRGPSRVPKPGYVMDLWPAGTTGVVVSVLFDGAWLVELEHDDWKKCEDLEDRYPRVDVADFLRCTWPLEVSA